MFIHKGIKSELNFHPVVKKALTRCIDEMFKIYNVDEIKCRIILSNDSNPNCTFLSDAVGITLAEDQDSSDFDSIALGATCDFNNLAQVIFQFSHELTHAIQHKQKRGLRIEFNLAEMKQKEFPPHHINETEAVANSIYFIENVFKYTWFNSRYIQRPDYYDYETAFDWVDSGNFIRQ